MEDFSQSPLPKDGPKPDEFLGREKSLLDMDDFETLETSPATNPVENFGQNLLDDFTGVAQSGFMSTSRPLGSNIEDVAMQEKGYSPSANLDFSDFEGPDKSSAIGGGNRTARPDQRGDRLLIDEQENVCGKESDDDEGFLLGSTDPRAEGDFAVSSKKVLESESPVPLPGAKGPKIGTETAPESSKSEFETSAYKPPAQPSVVQQRESAMEAEKTNKECECPFSPGAWFHPDKLDPTVAEYIYWRDPKKSGIAFGSLLVLLLSLKYFSVISVAAYITVAVLSVTTVYRIFKNVAQAIQKSNEGHPFKEYLDMDIKLSQEKVGATVEVIIEHINCVTAQLRSLVLVEDYFDTFKFGVLAWCLTYIGAWFNGLTLIILALVAAFTLPKVYEVNKTQIDMYAEMARTKSKEIIEMVNAKMPLGKKKKDQ